MYVPRGGWATVDIYVLGTRFVVKPEGVSNVFLTKPMGDQWKHEGLRGTREG